jgi:hypothetical protein
MMAAPVTAQELKLPAHLAERASESVNITLDSNMLQLAAKFFSDSKPDEAQVKKLIAGLKSIAVRSFEFEKTGEYGVADLESIRAQFRGPGWSRIMGVESKKDGENAEVYVRTEKDGKASGLGMVAAEAKELTVVSIVGAIDPSQFGELAGRFGIPKIPGEKKK